MKLRTLIAFSIGVVAGTLPPTPFGVAVGLFLGAVAGLISGIEVAK